MKGYLALSAKEKLCQALIYLMDEKAFEELSITDICREAGVNRSTFYSYYSNQMELLEDSHTYLVELFRANIPKIDAYPFSKQVLIPYLEFVKRYHRLYSVYNEHAKEYNHRAAFESLVENIFKPLYLEHGINDKTQVEYMTAFYLAGTRTVIRKWSRNGFKESEAEIADILQKCTFYHVTN